MFSNKIKIRQVEIGVFACCLLHGVMCVCVIRSCISCYRWITNSTMNPILDSIFWEIPKHLTYNYLIRTFRCCFLNVYFVSCVCVHAYTIVCFCSVCERDGEKSKNKQTALSIFFFCIIFGNIGEARVLQYIFKYMHALFRLFHCPRIFQLTRFLCLVLFCTSFTPQMPISFTLALMSLFHGIFNGMADE